MFVFFACDFYSEFKQKDFNPVFNIFCQLERLGKSLIFLPLFFEAQSSQEANQISHPRSLCSFLIRKMHSLMMLWTEVESSTGSSYFWRDELISQKTWHLDVLDATFKRVVCETVWFWANIYQQINNWTFAKTAQQGKNSHQFSSRNVVQASNLWVWTCKKLFNAYFLIFSFQRQFVRYFVDFIHTSKHPTINFSSNLNFLFGNNSIQSTLDVIRLLLDYTIQNKQQNHHLEFRQQAFSLLIYLVITRLKIFQHKYNHTFATKNSNQTFFHAYLQMLQSEKALRIVLLPYLRLLSLQSNFSFLILKKQSLFYLNQLLLSEYAILNTKNIAKFYKRMQRKYSFLRAFMHQIILTLNQTQDMASNFSFRFDKVYWQTLLNCRQIISSTALGVEWLLKMLICYKCSLSG